MAHTAAPVKRLDAFFRRANAVLRDKRDGFLARRPHRSFRRTRRRDYDRSFALPGYVPFSFDVLGVLLRNVKLFGLFFIVYSIVSAVILGIASQVNYAQVSGALQSSTTDVFVRVSSLFGAALSGGLNPTLDARAQVLAGLIVLFGWLVLVWLLRNVISGNSARKVTLRAGLYNAGTPLLPTFLVALVGALQALPILLVAIGYAAASTTGILDGGIEAMVFFGAAALLVLLSLYWLSATFIALVVVTLPGMYPLAALRAAGDLVVGRRLRVILRLLWMLVTVAVMWVVVLVPVILLDTTLNIAWLPLVPVFVLLLGTATLVWSSSYVYLLYRRLVDDTAAPA